MRRLTRTLTVVAAVSVSAGCGFGADDGSSSTPSTNAAPARGSSAPPAATKAYEITLAAAGDVLTHVAVRDSAKANGARVGRAYDFAPMFARIKDAVTRTDIAICHMETPLSPTDTDLSQRGTLVFNTPHEIADALKSTGWDGCDFATNHSYDRGIRGIADTRTVIERAGMAYAGPGSTKDEPAVVGWYAAKGLKIANLAYTYTILNDGSPTTTVPEDGTFLRASLWPAQKAAGIVQAARAARAAGADLVVVSMHWGQEYLTAPTKDQTDLAHALLSSPDVDLVLGSHTHVVQPCQTIHGKYVFYGLGNLLSNQSPTTASSLRKETQEGMLATVTFRRDASGRRSQTATFQPTRVNLDGHVIEPTSTSAQGASWARVVKNARSLGPGACAATPLGG